MATVLGRFGRVVVRQKASHKQFANDHERRTLAYHDARELGTVQLQQVAVEFGLTLDELREAL